MGKVRTITSGKLRKNNLTVIPKETPHSIIKSANLNKISVPIKMLVKAKTPKRKGTSILSIYIYLLSSSYHLTFETYHLNKTPLPLHY
jgi:hypothetical protein